MIATIATGLCIALLFALAWYVDGKVDSSTQANIDYTEKPLQEYLG